MLNSALRRFASQQDAAGNHHKGKQILNRKDVFTKDHRAEDAREERLTELDQLHFRERNQLHDLIPNQVRDCRSKAGIPKDQHAH